VAEYNRLDLAENRELDVGEKARMRTLGKELDKIWALEEIKVRQRSKDMMILKGVKILATYVMANRRNRKKKIENGSAEYS
jgi:hypothetical protein